MRVTQNSYRPCGNRGPSCSTPLSQCLSPHRVIHSISPSVRNVETVPGTKPGPLKCHVTPLWVVHRFLYTLASSDTPSPRPRLTRQEDPPISTQAVSSVEEGCGIPLVSYQQPIPEGVVSSSKDFRPQTEQQMTP